MKTFEVYFKEPVTRKVVKDIWNKQEKRWEFDAECDETSDHFTMYSLTAAKKLIKDNIEKYAGSCIYQTWTNGDFENLGEIKLKGGNKHFIANTRQTKANY